MPKRKFYFPVSQAINDDQDVFELTDRFGVGGLRVLLEYLRQIHVTENHFEDSEKNWRGIFYKCRVYPKNGWKIREKFVTNRWIMISKPFTNDLQIFCGSPNYWKYHNMQEPEGISWVPLSISISISSEVSSYKNTQRHYASRDFLDQEKGSENGNGKGVKMASMNLSAELKKETDRLWGFDREKYKTAQINKWVNQGRKNGWAESELAEVLRRFWDYSYYRLDEWWPMLESICQSFEAEQGRKAIRVEEAKHEAAKREEARYLGKAIREEGGG